MNGAQAMVKCLEKEGVEMNNKIVMSNNFAFGGVNTSLIFKKI